MTLILYDICTDSTKKRAVETTFRSRVKNGYFTVALVEEIFENFVPVSELCFGLGNNLFLE